MKRFYLAYSDESMWRQHVANFFKSLSSGQSPIWPQAVAKLDDSIPTIDYCDNLLRKFLGAITGSFSTR